MNEQSPYTPEEEAAREKLKAVLTEREFLEFEVYRDVIEDTYRSEMNAMKARYPDFHSSLYDSFATAFNEGEGKKKLDGWRLLGQSGKGVTDALGEVLLDKIHQYMNERERNN